MERSNSFGSRHSPRRDPRGRALRALAAVPVAVFVLLAACSGSVSGVECGDGTRLEGNKCVAILGGSDANADSTVGSETDSGSASDAVFDTPREAYAPEPCFSGRGINCDVNCPNPDLIACSERQCGGHVASIQQDDGDRTYRTPERPGTLAADAACGRYAYGVTFEVIAFAQYVVRVAPPYEIVTVATPNSPCCQVPTQSHGQCLQDAPDARGSRFIVVGTNDPEAPARNIQFLFRQLPTCN